MYALIYIYIYITYRYYPFNHSYIDFLLSFTDDKESGILHSIHVDLFSGIYFVSWCTTIIYTIAHYNMNTAYNKYYISLSAIEMPALLSPIKTQVYILLNGVSPMTRYVDGRPTSEVTPVTAPVTFTHPTMVTQRSWSWSLMINSHPVRSMSISPLIPDIMPFQTLTLKLEGQDHGYGQRARNIIETEISFFLRNCCQCLRQKIYSASIDASFVKVSFPF